LIRFTKDLREQAVHSADCSRTAVLRSGTAVVMLVGSMPIAVSFANCWGAI